MPQETCMTAILLCDKGTLPCLLIVNSQSTVKTQKLLAATIEDYKIANIPTFVMCTSSSNPAVVAAQGAPVPCVPAITSPWSAGSPTVNIEGKKALPKDDTVKCTLGGTISVKFPGQLTVNVES